MRYQHALIILALLSGCSSDHTIQPQHDGAWFVRVRDDNNARAAVSIGIPTPVRGAPAAGGAMHLSSARYLRFKAAAALGPAPIGTATSEQLQGALAKIVRDPSLPGGRFIAINQAYLDGATVTQVQHILQLDEENAPTVSTRRVTTVYPSMVLRRDVGQTRRWRQLNFVRFGTTAAKVRAPGTAAAYEVTNERRQVPGIGNVNIVRAAP